MSVLHALAVGPKHLKFLTVYWCMANQQSGPLVCCAMHLNTAIFYLAVHCTCLVSAEQGRANVELWKCTSPKELVLCRSREPTVKVASDEQNAALKQVALNRPDAPSKDELKSMGYDFAMKV